MFIGPSIILGESTVLLPQIMRMGWRSGKPRCLLLIAFKHITAIELDLPVIIFSTYDLFFTR